MCDPMTILAAVSPLASLLGADKPKDPPKAALPAEAVSETSGAEVVLAGGRQADIDKKKKAAADKAAEGGSSISTASKTGISIL